MAWLDEEDIEFLNPLMGRLTSTHQTRDHDTYLRSSGLLAGLHDLNVQLDKIALSGVDGSRTFAGTEHERLRELYTTASWQDTNFTMVAWLLKMGYDAIDGNADDASWPADDRITRGFERLPSAITGVERWLQDQRERGRARPPGPLHDSPLAKWLAGQPYRTVQRLAKDLGVFAAGPQSDMANDIDDHYAANGGAPPGFVA